MHNLENIENIGYPVTEWLVTNDSMEVNTRCPKICYSKSVV